MKALKWIAVVVLVLVGLSMFIFRPIGNSKTQPYKAISRLESTSAPLSASKDEVVRAAPAPTKKDPFDRILDSLDRLVGSASGVVALLIAKANLKSKKKENT